MLRRPFQLAFALALCLASKTALADLRVFDNQNEASPKTLDLYGWIQPRFSAQQTDSRVDFEPTPGFSVRRFRLGGIAGLETWARAQFELELSGAGVPPLLDAFVVAQPLAEFAFTAGQFRVPFSRQNLIRSKTLQLPDTAYFVAKQFIVDRALGAMVSGSLFEGRAKYFAGAYDSSDPGVGQTTNASKYFLYAARAELAPLGAAPAFEGDLRPVSERSSLLINLGGGLMHNRLDGKHLNRTYIGADIGLWFHGASLYAEYYHRRDQATDDAPVGTGRVTAEGFNLQAGYFLPLPWVEEHLELAARVEQFDPDKEVTHPAKGEYDLAQTNATWGYVGYIAGLNLFPFKTHDYKLQTSYEIRNETKRCLDGQAGNACTGYINANLFLVQATGSF